MIARILDRADYGRLVGTYLEPLIDALPPDTDVMIVEDSDGRIVGCSSMYARDHLECTWTAEDCRDDPHVFWALFRIIRETARMRGSMRILTASMDDRMSQFLDRMGAEHLPGAHYVWPIVKES